MWNVPLVRDTVFLVGAALIGGVIAVAFTPRGQDRHPGWAVRFYLGLFKLVPGLRASADRDTFGYRERLAATFFLVFFTVFAIASLGFGCSYRLGCQ